MEKPSSVANEAALKLSLRPEQLEVVIQFLFGRDAFAVLPIGFEKRLAQ